MHARMMVLKKVLRDGLFGDSLRWGGWICHDIRGCDASAGGDAPSSDFNNICWAFVQFMTGEWSWAEK